MKHRKHIAILTALVTALTFAVPSTALATGKTTLKVTTIKTMEVNTTKTLKVKSNGKVTCKTSNKNVISVFGKKLKAKKTGIAKITVTAKKNGCKSASKKFTVKVTPAQGKITSAKAQKNNISVTAKKLKGVTGYEFKYATNSKLKNATVKICKSNKISIEADTNKTYFVSVRGYKKSSNNILYGKWSKASEVKSAERLTEQPTLKPTVQPAEHNHSYTKSVTREVTCEVCGVITYTCDICGDSYDEYVDAGGHKWTTVEATGDEGNVWWQDAWDEPVYGSIVVCGGCGKTFPIEKYGSGNAAVNAAGEHIAAVFGDDCMNYHSCTILVDYIHHDAGYTTPYVGLEYQKCTKCGETKFPALGYPIKQDVYDETTWRCPHVKPHVKETTPSIP